MFGVMLRANWDAEVFHRCVRDAQGQILERLSFRRGEALLLTPQQVEACRGDLGHALVFTQVAKGEDGKPVATNKRLDPQPELPPPAPRRTAPSDADVRAENKRLKSELGNLSRQSAKLQEELSLAKGAADAAKAKLEEAELAEAELLDRVEKLEQELATATQPPADPPPGDEGGAK